MALMKISPPDNSGDIVQIKQVALFVRKLKFMASEQMFFGNIF